jgi:hypothetical protein
MRLTLPRGLCVAARSDLGLPGFHVFSFGLARDCPAFDSPFCSLSERLICPRTSSAQRRKAAEDYINEPVPQRSVIPPKTFEIIDPLEPEIKFASIF